MSFADIKDQQTAVGLLRAMTRLDRIPNGLLFWGPGGVGKRMAALEFAKAVNCIRGDGDACDTCLSCRKTEHGNHPDLYQVFPASRANMIRVEVIAGIVEMAMFRPTEGRLRVFVLHDADRIHEAAQNKFLKTLEEPPARCVFVLLTENPHLLLPTIRSRCQQVRFGTLNPQTISAILTSIESLSLERADAIASLSQGRMDRALELARTERREVVLDIIRRLIIGEDPLLVSEVFAAHISAREKALAEEIKNAFIIQEEDREDMEDEPEDAPDKEMLEAMIVGRIRREMIEYLALFDAWYRDELVYGLTGAGRLLFNRDQMQTLRKEEDVARFDVKRAAFQEAKAYIGRNIKIQRVFRDLFFVLSR